MTCIKNCAISFLMSLGHPGGTDALTYNQLGGMTPAMTPWSVAMRLGAVSAGIHRSRTVLPMLMLVGFSTAQSDQLAPFFGKTGSRKWSFSQRAGHETVRELAANNLQLGAKASKPNELESALKQSERLGICSRSMARPFCRSKPVCKSFG